MALTKVIGDGLGGTNDLTVDTTTLTVDATNNRVGIGSATPTKVLDITESASADTGQIKLTYDGGDGNRAGFILKNTHTGGREYGIYAGNNATGGGLGNSLAISDNTASTAYRLIIDSSGAVTMPSQPAFYVETSSTQTNFGLNSTHTLAFGTERFDQNADFASNVFTAPVTGKYFFNTTLRLESIDTGASYYLWGFDTSNNDYVSIIDPNFSADVSYISVSQNVVADMDAGDTAKVIFQQAGGTQQTDLQGAGGYSYFSGYLVA